MISLLLLLIFELYSESDLHTVIIRLQSLLCAQISQLKWSKTGVLPIAVSGLEQSGREMNFVEKTK